MKSIIGRMVLALIVLLSIATSALSQQGANPERDLTREQEIYDQLRVINPEAVAAFEQATQLMDENDLEAARQKFEQVLTMAPDFPVALRRLSYVESALGLVDAAIAHAGQALNLEDTPENHLALAQALLQTDEPENAKLALDHAQTAAEAQPDDVRSTYTLLMAGAANDDIGIVRHATATLQRIAPDSADTHFFVGLLAANDGKFEEARTELTLAQELGMPAEVIDEVLADIAEQERGPLARLSLVWEVLAAWVIGLGLLFATGSLLSRVTLAAVRKSRVSGAYAVKPGENLIRWLYRIVIILTSAYYYLSIPILLLIVVGLVVGILYLFFALGRVPLQLAAFIILMGVYTLYAIVRSLFTRVQESDPGRSLRSDEAPALWQLCETVAMVVGTRPINAIYVTPGVEIAVTERGTMWQKWRGKGQRCLILGLGALADMRLDQFKAILAHEYGHFSNRDTAGGKLAQQVLLSLNHMAYRLAVTGQARLFNPAWLFVNGFLRIYLRVTLGASRLQEVLADRFAALAYGADAFVDGLSHIVRRSVLFDAQVQHEVQAAITQDRPIHNLYTLSKPAFGEGEAEAVENRIQEAIKQPTSPYDSHPAVQERIDLVKRIPVQANAPSEEDTTLVWEVITDAPSLQDEMTAVVQANIERQLSQPSYQPGPQGSATAI